MKLRQLFENIYEQNGDDFDGSLKVIGVCFGRFNPPHRGHKAVWQAAAANPIWYVGTNQSTSGPKDPLPYDVKLQAMAAVWPKVAGHVIPEQSLLTLAARIYEEHGANVHLKVYTDEDWLVKTLTQYNGVKKEHGMYKFQQIDHVRTERLASATNLRAAVRNGDRAAFYKDMGIKPSVTINVGDKEYPVFDVVAHYLNKYPEKAKKAAVAEGEVIQFPKKHKSDLDSFDDCPKCGRDLMGGTYMGHRVKVCNPCKQVYLPPNSGIDQKGNKIDEADKHSLIGKIQRGEELYNKVKSTWKDLGDAQKKGDKEAASKAFKKHEKYANLRAPGTFTKVDEGDEERSQKALWAQITAHEKAAKKSKDLKQQHHLKMADQLRSQLKTSDDEVTEIAGAFPSPSTREKWAKDAAASNAAEAKRQADLAAKAQTQRLAVNTPDVNRLNQVNYHGANAPKPSNASWDGDSDFLDLDGTKYNKAMRMPISGDVPPDMKLIVTKEGRQVYLWTRNSLKGVVGRYFFPAATPNTIQESQYWAESYFAERAAALEEASGYIPKNKKEAKDPRWSTALTKDVTIGAIGKNLRAFKLAEQIAEMERDLIESSQKKITKRVQQATAGLNTYGDSEHVSGDYTGYRLGLAVAGADGKNPIDMKAKSWIGKKKSTHPYTKEEQDMLKQAYKAVGAEYHDMNKGDMKSKELDSTNKTSPVAKPKKNKYGV